MTTDPGAVPPDANPLPEGGLTNNSNGGGAAKNNESGERDLDELDNLIKGENQTDYHNQSPKKTTSLMQEMSTSSSLMQEDNSLLDNNGKNINNSNNGLTGSNNNGHGIPQAVATAGAVGAAVVGAAGAAAMAGGAAAMAGVANAASSAGMGPVKAPAASPMPPSQQPRGRRMCRRCQTFKPPRAHHCRYVSLYSVKSRLFLIVI